MMAIDEIEQRRASLAAELSEHKLDALLVSFLPNVRYLTGFTGSNGMLLLKASGEVVLFTDPRYRLAAGSQVSCPIKISLGPILSDVAALVGRRRIRTLGFEKARIGYEQYEFLKSKLPARSVLEGLGNLIEMRRM